VVRSPFGASRESVLTAQSLNDTALIILVLAAARGRQESGLARLLLTVVRSPFGASRESVLTAQSLNGTALIIRVLPAARGRQESGLARLLCAVLRPAAFLS
jgi:hypothetical protein